MTLENVAVEPENIDISDDEAIKQVFEDGEPEPTPEPEVKEEVKDTEPEKEKSVPYGALHEERQRRKELQAEIERFRQEQQQNAQVMQQVLQQLNQQNQPQVPSLEDDPVAYFNHKQQEQERALQEIARQQQERQQQEQQQQQHVQFVNAYRSAAQEFAQQTPDFTEAYSYVQQHRANELKAAGYPEHMIPQILQQNEAEIVAIAFQSGQNPAQKIYEIAKLRGYAAKQPQAEQKLQTVEKGIKASRISGGAPQGGEITLEALAEAADSLSPEEFNELWAKYAKTAK